MSAVTRAHTALTRVELVVNLPDASTISPIDQHDILQPCFHTGAAQMLCVQVWLNLQPTEMDLKQSGLKKRFSVSVIFHLSICWLVAVLLRLVGCTINILVHQSTYQRP